MDQFRRKISGIYCTGRNLEHKLAARLLHICFPSRSVRKPTMRQEHQLAASTRKEPKNCFNKSINRVQMNMTSIPQSTCTKGHKTVTLCTGNSFIWKSGSEQVTKFSKRRERTAQKLSGSKSVSLEKGKQYAFFRNLVIIRNI